MKSRDFLNEIKGLSAEELKVKAATIAEELMKLRFKNASGQFEGSHQFSELKRNLARVKTLMTAQIKSAAKAA